MNILEIIIIVAFLLFAAAGFRSGFVKKLASMVALVLSVILVAFFLPYITGFLRDNTPVYDMITEQCRRVVAEQTAGLLTGTQETEESGGTPALDREQIKSLLEANGYDSSIVDSLSDEQLQSYVQQYAQDYLQQSSEGGQDTTAAEPGRLEQMEIIENLPIPQVLKDLLQDHNNEEGYASLQVSTFQCDSFYIGSYTEPGVLYRGGDSGKTPAKDCHCGSGYHLPYTGVQYSKQTGRSASGTCTGAVLAVGVFPPAVHVFSYRGRAPAYVHGAGEPAAELPV